MMQNMKHASFACICASLNAERLEREILILTA
ncbi:hypothetical protein X753_30770 [Mesorhizobium sp. LNJC399B00]|nr:hypothetical protein X756_24485 [Mesorhizobium sp. LSHC412B00]ESX99191.1 hypothetical protein X753_30770 [Mesorhizobium sp. LNJC399B00]ESZ24236.1 hypothetical protein X734_23220 [Mesorhizobium sp. L2C084A000]